MKTGHGAAVPIRPCRQPLAPWNPNLQTISFSQELIWDEFREKSLFSPHPHPQLLVLGWGGGRIFLPPHSQPHVEPRGTVKPCLVP